MAFAVTEMARSLAIAIPLAVLAILPGLPGALAATSPVSRSPACLCSILGGAFVVNLGLASLASAVAWSLGGTMHAVLWIYASLAIGSLLLLRGVSPRWRRPSDLRFCVGWTAGAVLVSLPQGAWYVASDSFYHWAAARSLWLQDIPLPVDPIYGTYPGPADPTSGSLHVLVALWSRVLGLDPSALAGASNLVVAVLLGFTFYGLARRFATPLWSAAALLAMCLAMFGLDARAISYPNQVVVVCLMVVAALAIDVLEAPSARAVVPFAAAVSAALLIHTAGATSVAIELAVLVPTAVVLARQGRRAWPAVSAAAAVMVAALAAAGPLASRASVLLHGGVEAGGYYRLASHFLTLPLGIHVPLPIRCAGWTTPPASFSCAFGSLLFGVGAVAFAVALVARARATPTAWPGAAMAVLALVPMVPPMALLLTAVSPYLFVRTALPLAFSWFVAAAAVASPGPPQTGRSVQAESAPGLPLATHAEPAPRRAFLRGLAAACLAVAALGAAPAFASAVTGRTNLVRGREMTVADSWARDARAVFGRQALRDAAALLDDGRPVVAADPATAYYLAGLLPIRAMAVPATHSPLAQERATGAQRRAAAAALLSPIGSAQTKAAIARSYGVEFVAVSAYTPDRQAVEAGLRRLSDTFVPKLVSSGLTVFRVTPSPDVRLEEGRTPSTTADE